MESLGKTLMLKAEHENRVVTEYVGISHADFPHLFSELDGPNGEAVEKEIIHLISKFWQARARRWPVNVFAKLCYQSEQGEHDEDVVLVEDISTSGIRVAAPPNLQVKQLAKAEIHLKVSYSEDTEDELLVLPLLFMRLAGIDEKHAHLAFRFESISPDEERSLDNLVSLSFH